MTANHARVLHSCTTIFIDGTFRTAPHPYVQLVTVHGLYMGAVILVCFGLSTGKTVGHYRQILTGLRNAVRGYNGHRWQQPNMVICDFEISLITAVETKLLGAQIRCCYFHLHSVSVEKVQWNRPSFSLSQPQS